MGRWIIVHPMTEKEELAHETFEGVDWANSLVEGLVWNECPQPLKDAAKSWWAYAGRMYGRLIDGKGVPKRPIEKIG